MTPCPVTAQDTGRRLTTLPATTPAGTAGQGSPDCSMPACGTVRHPSSSVVRTRRTCATRYATGSRTTELCGALRDALSASAPRVHFRHPERSSACAQPDLQRSLSTYTTRASGATACATSCVLSIAGSPVPMSRNCRTRASSAR